MFDGVGTQTDLNSAAPTDVKATDTETAVNKDIDTP